MYFSGKLSIDPSKVTNIDVIKPTKAFGRLLHFVTMGRTSPKEEQETFTAVSILQQVNRGFREVGITNVVRLAKDDVDFYFDDAGKDDDLRETLDAFNLDGDALEVELFQSLILTTEHEKDSMKYLIEVIVKRTHPVGEFPINVKVNAIPLDFRRGPQETQEQLRARMDRTFATKEAYEAYVDGKRASFDEYLNQLDSSIRRHLKVDEIKREGKARIVRPKKRSRKTPVKPPCHRASSEPAFHGYYDFDDVFFFSLFWSDMVHDHHYPVENVDIVDDHGETMLSVGDAGFTAGDTNTLNSEADFEGPNEGDIDYHSGHSFDDDFQKSGVLSESSGADVTDSADRGGGWLSDVFDSSDSGSSCGSSCGASCGGGCGGD